jgi:type I restriction enzyme S subunit
LRGDNIVNGALRWDGVVRWPNSDTDAYQAFALKSGDLVLAMDRTWVKSGLKFAMIQEKDLPLLQVQRVARMRCRPSLLNRFLSYQIESPAFTRYILEIQTGLGVPHISGKQIAAFNFLKPSLPEQDKIVRQLDRMKANVASFEAAHESKLAALTELKKSLLQKAFAGELT